MMRYVHFLTALFLALNSAYALAADFAQLRIDLDGDSHPETIVASTSGTGDFKSKGPGSI